MAVKSGELCIRTSKKPPIVRRKRKFVVQNVLLISVIALSQLVEQSSAQYPGNNPLLGDRDPRFYSRPGVDYNPNYNPTNPGDKEYR